MLENSFDNQKKKKSNKNNWKYFNVKILFFFSKENKLFLKYQPKMKIYIFQSIPICREKPHQITLSHFNGDIEYKEYKHYKQKNVKHLAIVSALSQPNHSIHCVGQKTTRPVHIVINAIQQFVLVFDLVINVDRERLKSTDFIA